MEPAAIGASPTRNAQQPQRGIGSLESEDFFKILITELQSQDPFKPAETSDMISQVSEIRSIELSSDLTDTLDAIASQQRTAGTGEMLGKFVSAATRTASGEEQLVEGIVTAVRYNPDGQAMLELDNGQTVRAADVVWMSTLEEAERRLAILEEQQAAGATGATSAEPAALSTAKADLASRIRSRTDAAEEGAEKKQPWFKWNFGIEL